MFKPPPEFDITDDILSNIKSEKAIFIVKSKAKFYEYSRDPIYEAPNRDDFYIPIKSEIYMSYINPNDNNVNVEFNFNEKIIEKSLESNKIDHLKIEDMNYIYTFNDVKLVMALAERGNEYLIKMKIII